VRCSQCGEEHAVGEPAFGAPDEVFAIPAAERAERVRGNKDLVILDGTRFFVRAVLPVTVVDQDQCMRWGVWVELSSEDAREVYDRWDDADQAECPPMEAHLANRIPGYPDTMGEPMSLQLTGPTSRPSATFPPDATCSFARECLAGVTAHRAAEWVTRR
jgi:hypothetical protein